jgi:hypothetical protein
VTAVAVPALAADAEAVSRGLLAVLVGSGVLAVGAGVLLLLLRRTRVTVSGDFLDAHLMPIRVMHIALGEVAEVEVPEVGPSRTGGIGWRVVGSGRFLLLSSGPAVRVTLTAGGRRVLRSDRADELARCISAAASGAKGGVHRPGVHRTRRRQRQ